MPCGALEHPLDRVEDDIGFLLQEEPGDVVRESQHRPLLLKLIWLALNGRCSLDEEVAAHRQKQRLSMDILPDTGRASGSELVLADV